MPCEFEAGMIAFAPLYAKRYLATLGANLA